MPSYIPELRYILQRVDEIIASHATWEVKYHLIFSDEISGRVAQLSRLDYCDPDTTYEEDVLAWVTAFRENVASFGNLDLT